TQAAQPQATPEAEPEPVAPVSTAPIRRSINVRRVEGVAEVVAPEPPPEPRPALAAQRAPVRRIALNRDGDAAEPQPRPTPVATDEDE
ncbi:MAG: hypothetical protein HGA19_02280, partial [Oscillochloris sp.]|nr:hypothetical protein [Oscillochloris sp.]